MTLSVLRGGTGQRTARTRVIYEVEAARVPQPLRIELARGTCLCYVQEPEEVCPDLYRTRVADIPREVAAARVIYLTTQEHTALRAVFASVTSSDDAYRVLRAAPAYFFPYDLQTICSSVAMNITDCVQTLFDICWFKATDLYDEVDDLRMVYVAFLPGRLNGHQHGQVFTTWVPQDRIAEAVIWTKQLEGLNSSEQRLCVNQHVVANGAQAPAVLPPEEISVALLEEDQYHLVPLKDPITLRKEDLLGIQEEQQEAVLEVASLRVQEQRESLLKDLEVRREVYPLCLSEGQRQVLLQDQSETLANIQRLERLGWWLQEVEIWLTGLPKKEQERIIHLSPIYEDIEMSVHTKSGRIKLRKGKPVTRWVNQQTGYQLVVGIPIHLITDPLPKNQQHVLRDIVYLPSEGQIPIQCGPDPKVA